LTKGGRVHQSLPFAFDKINDKGSSRNCHIGIVLSGHRRPSAGPRLRLKELPMPDLDQIKQGKQEARDRRSLMFLVIWAMSVVLLGGVGRAAEERLSIAGLDVMVWRPDEPAPAALPIRLLPWLSWLRHPVALPDDRARLGGLSRRCFQPS
jgi:hypothetical protein